MLKYCLTVVRRKRATIDLLAQRCTNWVLTLTIRELEKQREREEKWRRIHQLAVQNPDVCNWRQLFCENLYVCIYLAKYLSEIVDLQLKNTNWISTFWAKALRSGNIAFLLFFGLWNSVCVLSTALLLTLVQHFQEQFKKISRVLLWCICDVTQCIIPYRRQRSLNLWTTVILVTIQQLHCLNATITILHLTVVLKTLRMARNPRLKATVRYLFLRCTLVIFAPKSPHVTRRI